MDDEQREKVQQEELARARAKLTQEQRERLEWICENRLREGNAYAPKHEIAIAGALYESRHPRHQAADIDAVITHAYNEARLREAKEANEANLRAYKEAELERTRQLEQTARREAEQLRQQEIEKQTREQREREAQKAAVREIARNEPIPGSVRRFETAITEKKAERNAADFERLEKGIGDRPNFARHDELKHVHESVAPADKGSEHSTPRGEISDAKAERLAKLDNMHQSANERAKSIQTGRDTSGRGGGGRGSR